MTYWKVPGAKLHRAVKDILKAVSAGCDMYLTLFDPELEAQLYRLGFDVNTIKFYGDYYTMVKL